MNPPSLPALESIAVKNPVRRPDRSSDTKRVRAWLEAYEAGMAPEVVLGATHVSALEFVPIEALTARAVAPDAV